MKKLTIPKGTRDFSANELQKRNQIIKVIKKNFELFGFSPLETPSFENLETLSGKYGDEGDQLIFKIIDSGDFIKSSKALFYELSELKNEEEKKKFIENKLSAKALLGNFCSKALRYDLTIPFARYVMTHKNELTFPFKRYQIQPVWRADRPQKGRYREFYQCDVDVIGSTSLWQEFDFIRLYDKIFGELNLEVDIQINHRGLLVAIAETLGVFSKWNDFVIILDKWDKIGPEKVFEEMINKGIDQKSIKKLEDFLYLNKLNWEEKFSKLSLKLKDSQIGKKALEELNFIYDKLKKLPLQSAKLNLNLTLARGLNYYTGTIFEILPRGLASSSIGGGGRYDHLTEAFGEKGYSGIGISFGLDRIYLVMEDLGLFENLETPKEILFINFGEEESLNAYKCLSLLRNKGIPASFYPESIKIDKQFKYASKKNFGFVAMIGQEEIKKNRIKIKNLNTGIQKEFELDFKKTQEKIEDLVNFLK